VAALCVASWAQIPQLHRHPRPAPPTPTQALPLRQFDPPRSNPKPSSPSAIRASSFSSAAPTRSRSFQRWSLGGFVRLGFFSRSERDQLVGSRCRGRPYFGTSKIPQAVPAPFPTQIYEPAADPTSTRPRESITFFLAAIRRAASMSAGPRSPNLLYGHQGVRGVPRFDCGPLQTEVSSGRALVAGGGLDYKSIRVWH